MQVDALKQKIKPTPVVVTPVQTPAAPVQISGMPVVPPPPVTAPLKVSSNPCRVCSPGCRQGCLPSLQPFTSYFSIFLALSAPFC